MHICIKCNAHKHHKNEHKFNARRTHIEKWLLFCFGSFFFFSFSISLFSHRSIEINSSRSLNFVYALMDSGAHVKNTSIVKVIASVRVFGNNTWFSRIRTHKQLLRSTWFFLLFFLFFSFFFCICECMCTPIFVRYWDGFVYRANDDDGRSRNHIISIQSTLQK